MLSIVQCHIVIVVVTCICETERHVIKQICLAVMTAFPIVDMSTKGFSVVLHSFATKNRCICMGMLFIGCIKYIYNV